MCGDVEELLNFHKIWRHSKSVEWPSARIDNDLKASMLSNFSYAQMFDLFVL